MRVQFDTSVSSVFQHVLAAGNFTGKELSRPTLTHGSGNYQLIFRSKNLGNWMDDQKVELSKGSSTATIVRYDSTLKTLFISAKASGGLYTATAAEIAAKVQEIVNDCPILCTYGGTGGAVPLADLNSAFAAVADPVNRRNVIYAFSHATADGGLFCFNNYENLIIKHFEAKLGASVAWTLKVVHLDEGMLELTGEDTLLASGTGANVFVPLDYCLHPLRALKFEAATTGLARVIAHREAPHPNNR